MVQEKIQVGDRSYEFDDDKARIPIQEVYSYLAEESYWARGRPRDVVETSIERSYCLGCYASDGKIAGFARVVTDWSTMYYLCDVYVAPAHRGIGLGKELVRAVVEDPRLANLSGLLLTADAHGLYSRYGFVQNEQTASRFMRKPRPSSDVITDGSATY